MVNFVCVTLRVTLICSVRLVKRIGPHSRVWVERGLVFVSVYSVAIADVLEPVTSLDRKEGVR